MSRQTNTGVSLPSPLMHGAPKFDADVASHKVSRGLRPAHGAAMTGLACAQSSSTHNCRAAASPSSDRAPPPRAPRSLTPRSAASSM